MSNDSFFSDNEKEICKSFLENGYYIFDLPNKDVLGKIKKQLFESSKEYLKLDSSVQVDDFFDNAHNFVSVENLNDFRVFLIKKMESYPELRKDIYFAGKEKIDIIVGNELCMQRAVNLSIQLPNDTSSILPLHTDVWSGNSPYEVVFWLPLVDCFETKSMYVAPINKSKEVIENFSEYSHLNVEDLYQKIKKDTLSFKVPFGSGVIFSHSLLHGNRINEEDSARWSFNVRFKSALTPYGSKEVGETFLPISVRPSTRVGYEYKKPSMDK